MPHTTRSCKTQADPWATPPGRSRHRSAGSASVHPQTRPGGGARRQALIRDPSRAHKRTGQVLTAAERQAGERQRPAPSEGGRRRQRPQPRGTPAGAHEALDCMGAAIVGTQRRAERATATRDDGTTNPALRLGALVGGRASAANRRAGAGRAAGVTNVGCAAVRAGVEADGPKRRWSPELSAWPPPGAPRMCRKRYKCCSFTQLPSPRPRKLPADCKAGRALRPSRGPSVFASSLSKLGAQKCRLATVIPRRYTPLLVLKAGEPTGPLRPRAPDFRTFNVSAQSRGVRGYGHLGRRRLSPT